MQTSQRKQEEHETAYFKNKKKRDTLDTENSLLHEENQRSQDKANKLTDDLAFMTPKCESLRIQNHDSKLQEALGPLLPPGQITGTQKNSISSPWIPYCQIQMSDSKNPKPDGKEQTQSTAPNRHL